MTDFSMPDILTSVHQLVVECRPFSGYILIVYGLAECFAGCIILKYLMALTGFFLAFLIGYWITLDWIGLALLRYLAVTLLGIGIGALFFFIRETRIFAKGILVFWILSAAILHLFKISPNNMFFIGIASLGGLIFLMADTGTRNIGLAMLGAFLFFYGLFISFGWEGYWKTFEDMSFFLNMLDMDFRFKVFCGWISLLSIGILVQNKITSK